MKFILYRNNSKTQSSHLKTKSFFLFSSTPVGEQCCRTNESNTCENELSLGNSESNCAFVFQSFMKSPQLTLVHGWGISVNWICKYVIIPTTSPMFTLYATLEMGEIFMWSALGWDNFWQFYCFCGAFTIFVVVLDYVCLNRFSQQTMDELIEIVLVFCKIGYVHFGSRVRYL